MNNKEIAQVFYNIADLLEIKGEVVYKVLAYRRAAKTLANYGQDVTRLWRAGKLKNIPGVGRAIADKISELLATSRLDYYEMLKREVPLGLVEVLSIPDVGPRKAALFWKELGITSVQELEQAARAGRLRRLPSMGAKSEAKILAGIAARARQLAGRRPAGDVWPLAMELVKFLRGLPGVSAAEAAGSLRRRCVTIGDLDLLAAAADPLPVMGAFVRHPQVARVLEHGPTKTSVELVGGLQADLRVLPPERFGSLLQYFTGSKEHNVRLRELAQTKGLSLSERGFARKNGEEILCATESEVYKTLGLHYIPPELREDRGELAAALWGELPPLVQVKDLQSDLHTHSNWSDGTASIREMAVAVRGRSLKCLAITDHSHSLSMTGGLTPERLRAQRRELDEVQADLGASFSLLHGVEVEIHPDGSLDYSDDVLEDLDVVVAAPHASLHQARPQITARLLIAVRNRHVDILAHPTGRLFPDRQGADVDMEALLTAAAESGVALEINAHPARLDLEDVYVRRAVELGCLLSINTDAHQPADFDSAHFGVGIARRAWVRPEMIINTWPVEKLLQWLDERGHRRPRKAPTFLSTAAPPSWPVRSEVPACRPAPKALPDIPVKNKANDRKPAWRPATRKKK